MLLSASAAFAASDDNATVSEVDDEISVDENVLTVDEDDVAVESEDAPVIEENSTPVAESPVVTNSTFNNYFDDSGNLFENVTSDELVFEGDFTGVNVSYITVNKAIKFSGKNATFDGVTFFVDSDNVTIDGFTLNQDKDSYLFLISGKKDITISNNVIDYKALEGANSYVILADVVDTLNLIDNTITYVGNTDGSVYNRVVNIVGDKEEKSKNVVISGNVFNISIPSSAVYYDEFWNSYDYTDGISILGSENVTISENEITLNFNNVTGGADTINVIVVGSSNCDWDYFAFFDTCKNVIVANNTIDATGYTYIYGIRVVADNFVVDGNELNISADSHYADAIVVDGPSDVGVVSNNVMNVKAPNMVFGVYSYPYMGPVANVTFDSNTIVADAYASCGMEIVEENPTISNNVITLTGNHTTGIVANMNVNGTISGNEIASLGSNIGKNDTGDSLIHLESVGISVKGDTLIADNCVQSTSIGANLILGGEFTLVNNTIDVDACGDTDNYGIYAKDIDGLDVSGNKISFVGYTNGTIYSNGLLVDGIDNVTIINNTFGLSLVSADVMWIEEPEGSWNYVKYPVSEGIVIKNSKGAKFDGNSVILVHNNVTGYLDTIYVVDLDASDNSVISNNNIVASGHTYIYGVIATSANFTIENNNITSVSDAYAAYAINPDAGASGVVKNNTLVAIAPNVTYTVYSMMYGGNAGMDIDYIGNQVYGKGYYVNAFDIGGDNENIINNTIITVGNYTVAIYSGSNNNVISGNTIRALGSGEGNVTQSSTVNEIEAIKLSGANAVISENYIESTGDYAVNLGNSNSTVENNYIAAKKSVGKSAVTNAGSGAVIANATPSLKTILFAADLYTVYGDEEAYSVRALDENGDAIANVTIILSYANGTVIDSQVTNSKGAVAFYVDFDAGAYDVVATFYGNNVYGPKSIKGIILVDPKATEISASSSVSVLLTAIKSGSYFEISLKDLLGNGIAGKTVTVSFNGKTNDYVTDENGVIKYKLSATKTGTKTLTMKFEGDNNYFGDTATATVKITKEASKLTAAKKTFKAKAKTKKYTVTLKDSKGKAIKKVKVTIKVKGKTYKATTNKKGKATFKITKLTKKGTFKAKVKFAGNKYYKATSKTVKIKVKK